MYQIMPPPLSVLEGCWLWCW